MVAYSRIETRRRHQAGVRFPSTTSATSTLRQGPGVGADDDRPGRGDDLPGRRTHRGRRLRAACSAKIYGIGVDVAQYQSLPARRVASSRAPKAPAGRCGADVIKRVKDKGLQKANFFNDATNDGIGYSAIRISTRFPRPRDSSRRRSRT